MIAEREFRHAGDSRFHWPPERRWFLAAWALFALSLALPAVRWPVDAAAIFGGTPDTLRGFHCIEWSAVFLWDVLKAAFVTSDHLATYVRYYAALGLCNFFMALSVFAVPLLAHRSRVFQRAGFVAAAAALGVASWFPHETSNSDIDSLPGAYVWAVSFVVLAAAFFRAASTLRNLEASPE